VTGGQGLFSAGWAGAERGREAGDETGHAGGCPPAGLEARAPSAPAKRNLSRASSLLCGDRMIFTLPWPRSAPWDGCPQAGDMGGSCAPGPRCCTGVGGLYGCCPSLLAGSGAPKAGADLGPAAGSGSCPHPAGTTSSFPHADAASHAGAERVSPPAPVWALVPRPAGILWPRPLPGASPALELPRPSSRRAQQGWPKSPDPLGTHPLDG